MAGTRQIQRRLKAVNNIGRVTRTMEMISTAKYKAYHNRRKAAVEYHNALAQIGYLLTTPQKPIDHPLLRENKSGRMAIFAIGSTRGLCGSYNDQIYRIVDANIQNASLLGKELDIYAAESRLINTFNYHRIKLQKKYSNTDEILASGQLDEIANYFIEQYMAGLINRFGIVYMRYYSASSQRPETLSILPLTELISDLTIRSTIIWPWKYTFEDFYLSPSASEIIKSLARIIMRSSIETCLMDAALSEHLARMIAMRNATENAEDMTKELTNDYNRARQGQITSELLDIISGTGDLR
ncbi:MAG: ATP synthase F1 subunit gamma [Sedimentisphaerales bacterium]